MKKIFKRFRGTYSDILIFGFLLIYSFRIGQLTTIKILGYVIALSGATAWAVARWQLGDSFSVLPKAAKIIKVGLYKKIRHPMYLSGIIAILGLSILYRKTWLYIYLFLLIIIQTIRIKSEEKVLMEKFGQEYSIYKNSNWF
jgi:protein-S-isoprenylcysteine O-methyltransferase Ste14